MSLFTVFAILITATALFSYLNEKLFRLPTTIGVMVGALGASLLLILLDRMGLAETSWAREIVSKAEFDDLLLEGMLSFLLFAGALHVNLEDLLSRKWVILTLATVGILISTFVVGSVTWWLFGLLGLDLPYSYALAFGALISPTDPIAVLGLLKKAGTPKSLETIITGESLFNDGVGVVVFLVILESAAGGHEVSAASIGLLFGQEAVGGILFGLALGVVAFLLLRGIDNYKVEALITVAVVAGGYALAGALHLSGPLAMVIAGLFVGNHGRVLAMSERTREHLDNFWEFVDEILNAVLFMMIGLEVLVLDVEFPYLLAGLLVIFVVLASRMISVGVPILAFGLRRRFPPLTTALMTWGGLRGGISIALALSLPTAWGSDRSHILIITYTVVVFSILVQGLTLGRLARAAARRAGVDGS